MLIPKDTFDQLMSRATGSPRARVRLAVVYAALVGTALLWMLVHVDESPFAGALAVLLTLPWSLLAVPLAIIVPDGLPLLWSTVLMGAGAGVNVRLLLRAGANRDPRGRY